MPRHLCPLCGGHRFKDYRGRINAACVGCGAKERHRLLGLILPRILPDELSGAIVHMAPELGIARLLHQRFGGRYVPVDISPEAYSNMPVPVRKFDLTRPLDTFEPESAGAVVHCHVLEHIFAPVSDVIRDLNKTILPGGFHIFQVPIRQGTYEEDQNANLSAQEREERFGQYDHVRWFGDEDLQETLLQHFEDFDRLDVNTLVRLGELERASIGPDAFARFTSNTPFVFRKHGHASPRRPHRTSDGARTETSSSKPLHVYLAALTRKRPAMLARLLRSWQALIHPEDVKTTFLIVENNDSPTEGRAVETFATAVAPHEVRYVLESRIGIPFARNRAVAEMLRSDATLLLFVDDDETVAPDWLREMVEEFRRSNALLIGGPVLAAPPSFDLPWLPGQVFKGIAKRYNRKALQAAKRAKAGAPQATTVVTSNWLGHRDLFEKYNLRFDEGLAMSGGSDAKFDDRVTTAGLEKSWAENAYVSETIPWSRLSVGYQFRRGRDQSIASFQRRRGREPARAMLLLPIELLLRLIFVILLAMAVPLTGGRSLLDLARAAGWIVGRCVALVGVRSRLYETVTGE